MSVIRQFVRAKWLPLVLVIGLQHLDAAERHPTGREIFRQQCAKCHGANGEGVKGKYDGPLQGERSLEKLTRYIERNMPDDNPGKCVGDNAAAVAHYIYDNFYSRQARLRSNKPPRIELARLTNRQYLNSIADLMKEFTGRDEAPNDERGLRAIYFSSKDFAGDKKAIERVDRMVNFDFSEGAPDEKLKGTNGFSMQWRGSVKADETGEYDFILKTPNGARLWINDDIEPVIDAWVASGKVSEHKATLRLLGGRLYPLQLNYFKSKETTASISLQWKPPHGTQAPIPFRNLSPADSKPTLVISTPFPPDDSSLGYERGVSVSKAWDEATTSAAIEVANYVASNLDRISGSKRDETNRAATLEAFCAKFVTAALHRPLTPQEKSIFILEQFKRMEGKAQRGEEEGQKGEGGRQKKEVQSARKETGQIASVAQGKPPEGRADKAVRAPLEDAVKRVVLLTLKSPRFLYVGLQDLRATKGPAAAVPDDFEVAARLSYGLWDSLPDPDLRKLALQGALHTPRQVAEQSQRMLTDPRTREKMQGFFHHWLQMDRVENLSKDDTTFPGFTPAIIADLRTSLDLFLEDTMWNGAADYRTLLLADYLFLNNHLATFYGVSCEATDDFAKVTLKPGERCGVLTHPYLLTAFSYQKLTSPIHRGVFLTRNIVGRSLKPPPMAMTFKDADFAPDLTMRQKVAELTRGQNCQSCHAVINPLGFSLEQYDAVGRFRTSENDRPVDPVSDYLTDDGQTVHLAGAADVAKFAIGSEQAQNAFIQQLFHHVVKQPLLAYGAHTLTRLRQSLIDSDFNMQKLLLEIVKVSALNGSDMTPATRTGASTKTAGAKPEFRKRQPADPTFACKTLPRIAPNYAILRDPAM